MAVYTRVDKRELENLLTGYTLGHLHEIHEILAGVENSNFRIHTETGRYILTLYEKRVNVDDIPFFIDLMRHAALKGIRCPYPISDSNGRILHQLSNRPAAIVSYLQGEATTSITPVHCQQLGEALARFHLAMRDFKQRRTNSLSYAGWEKLVLACTAQADQAAAGLGALITSELHHLKERWPKTGTLPEGIIHADLFPDNVFFESGKLCGLIDFYFSCNDFLAYDLAVCANSWCFEGEKNFSPARYDALVKGYESIRPLNAAEKETLPLLLRGAALRFLLTRLYDLLNQAPGAVVKVKDPLEYQCKLLFFREAFA